MHSKEVSKIITRTRNIPSPLPLNPLSTSNPFSLGTPSLQVHSKEVSKIVCQRVGDATVIYTASLDGSIALTEEQGGKLVVRTSIQQVFGPSCKVY